MKTIWIHDGLNGESVAKAMPLPFKHLERPIDPEIFRRQARGEDIGKAKMFNSQGLSTIRFVGEHVSEWAPAASKCLCFVLSGDIDIEVGHDERHQLSAGDVFLEDDCNGHGHRITFRGDCRLVKLLIADDWQPHGNVPPTTTDSSNLLPRSTNLKRMYRAKDDLSYFRTFDELFVDTNGTTSSIRSVLGFYFVSFPSGYFIDLHPEGANNFVIVTEGDLELEVSGDGRIEVFGPGDVVLAEDRIGVGHIDRMHGLCRLIMIVFDDKHLWEVPA